MENHPQNPPPAEVGTTTDEVSLPVQHAAHSLRAVTLPVLPDFSLQHAVAELSDSLHTQSIHPLENSTRAMLAAQSRVLDSLFNRLIIAAHQRPYVDNDRVDLALRAQRQCCRTITTLDAIRQSRGSTKL